MRDLESTRNRGALSTKSARRPEYPLGSTTGAFVNLLFYTSFDFIALTDDWSKLILKVKRGSPYFKAMN